MDWRECTGKLLAKAVGPDPGLVKSLVKTSQNRLISEGKLPLDIVTAGSKISLAYDSMRELLEALALSKGYKIYNHECYTAFLKEVLGETSKGDIFDGLRRARNKINYYGKEVSVEEAKDLLPRIRELRSFILSLLEKSQANPR